MLGVRIGNHRLENVLVISSDEFDLLLAQLVGVVTQLQPDLRRNVRETETSQQREVRAFSFLKLQHLEVAGLEQPVNHVKLHEVEKRFGNWSLAPAFL